MSFDLKVTLSSDGTPYVQVVKLSALSHGDKTIKKNFDESMTSFQKYVGKAYKLPTSLTQGSRLDPEFIQKNILNALNILDQKPLFYRSLKTRRFLYSWIEIYSPSSLSGGRSL
jgi:hypothetical protein